MSVYVLMNSLDIKLYEMVRITKSQQ